jgi:hypothetical protein
MPRAAHSKSKIDGEWASAVGELATKFRGTRAPGSFFGASGRRRQRGEPPALEGRFGEIGFNDWAILSEGGGTWLSNKPFFS